MFQLLCVIVLLGGRDGESVDTRAPNYVREKMGYLDDATDLAFGALDAAGQAYVLTYCKHWRLPVPPNVQRLYQSFYPEYQFDEGESQ